jgi:hypothetical protein
MKYAIVTTAAACMLAFGLVAPATVGAQAMLDPPSDGGFYECTPALSGFVMRYAVGSPPNQTIYVYQCDGANWFLIDIEYL